MKWYYDISKEYADGTGREKSLPVLLCLFERK